MYRNDPHNAETRLQRRLARVQLLDFSFCVGKVHVHGDRVAIDQERNGALVAYDLGGGGKRHRRHQHGLSRAEAEDFNGEMQGRGGGVHGHGMFPAHLLREDRLELLRSRAGGQPARAKARDDLVDLCFADRRTKIRNLHSLVISHYGRSWTPS